MFDNRLPRILTMVEVNGEHYGVRYHPWHRVETQAAVERMLTNPALLDFGIRAAELLAKELDKELSEV